MSLYKNASLFPEMAAMTVSGGTKWQRLGLFAQLSLGFLDLRTQQLAKHPGDRI
jgi:hypothetical protein